MLWRATWSVIQSIYVILPLLLRTAHLAIFGKTVQLSLPSSVKIFEITETARLMELNKKDDKGEASGPESSDGGTISRRFSFLPLSLAASMDFWNWPRVDLDGSVLHFSTTYARKKPPYLCLGTPCSVRESGRCCTTHVVLRDIRRAVSFILPLPIWCWTILRSYRFIQLLKNYKKRRNWRQFVFVDELELVARSDGVLHEALKDLAQFMVQDVKITVVTRLGQSWTSCRKDVVHGRFFSGSS